jgi:hypothetical protein
VDADEHRVAEHGEPALSPQQQGSDRRQYGVPPKQQQPGSGTRRDDTDVAAGRLHQRRRRRCCSTAVGCWQLLVGASRRTTEAESSRPDSNDTRMQQVTYANGKLWGALDTALNPTAGRSGRASRGTS